MATTTSTTSSPSSLGISGLASGFNWQTVVAELVAIEEAPEQQLQTQQSTIQQQQSELSTIQTALTTLQTDAAQLANPSFYGARTATASDPSLATVTADSGAGIGTYNFNVTKLASAAVLEGTAGASGTLSPTGDVSTLTLSSAPFATPVTAGTFTVNGQQITITTGETLQDVFTQISTATNSNVTASYSATNDEITLSSSSPIVLGSDTDTSNFLQVAQLYNNGGNTITSATKLGAVDLGGPADQSNLATALNDGGNGQGEFIVNGVTIDWDASTDSISDILNRINQSGAGVTATYNAETNQFSLTNQSTGNVGISVQDVTGNFLAATGLAGGTLQDGQNLLYTINDGPELQSQSDTISAASSGISGLSVTALNTGTFKVSVAADTSSIASAITSFVSQYNSLQSTIDSQIQPTTSASGAVTPGLLQGDPVVYSINNTLRQMISAAVPGLSGTMQQLANLGFTSNGTTDALTTTNTTTLDNALATNLAGVQALFSTPNTGLAVQLNNYLTDALGSTGGLATDQSNLTQESDSITKQINQIQTQAQADQSKYTAEFVAMEEAESTINAQMAYLNSEFGTSGSTSGSASASTSSSS